MVVETSFSTTLGAVGNLGSENIINMPKACCTFCFGAVWRAFEDTVEQKKSTTWKNKKSRFHGFSCPKRLKHANFFPFLEPFKNHASFHVLKLLTFPSHVSSFQIVYFLCTPIWVVLWCITLVLHSA